MKQPVFNFLIKKFYNIKIITMTQAIQNETRSVRDMLIAAKVLAKDGKATESPCKTLNRTGFVGDFFI
ncbi:hypothetical protein GHT90_18935 [Acinetobacter baumannii]|nr:hypothetical protein [Acinetobacter baumannii]